MKESRPEQLAPRRAEVDSGNVCDLCDETLVESSKETVRRSKRVRPNPIGGFVGSISDRADPR